MNTLKSGTFKANAEYLSQYQANYFIFFHKDCHFFRNGGHRQITNSHYSIFHAPIFHMLSFWQLENYCCL